MTTATATPIRTTPRAERAARTIAPIPLTRLMGVELRKMFDTRAGFWLMASIVITIFLTASLLGFAHSFVSGITAGVISPLLSHDDFMLALGMTDKGVADAAGGAARERLRDRRAGIGIGEQALLVGFRRAAFSRSPRKYSDCPGWSRPFSSRLPNGMRGRRRFDRCLPARTARATPRARGGRRGNPQHTQPETSRLRWR